MNPSLPNILARVHRFYVSAYRVGNILFLILWAQSEFIILIGSGLLIKKITKRLKNG